VRSDLHTVGITLQELFDATEDRLSVSGLLAFGIASLNRVIARAICEYECRFTSAAEMSQQPAGGKDSVLRDTKLSLEKALTDVRDAAAAALKQFQTMASQPDEVEITFGVKLDAQAGAVIAKTSIQGHFEVKLKWERASIVTGMP
jgi:Trypsin-co-occurring domain 1